MSSEKDVSLKKEIIVRNTLIIVTIISLIINALVFTNIIYSYGVYDTTKLNSVIVNPVFNFILWLDNFFVYLFAAWYMVIGEKSKKEVMLKLVFSLFAVLTTISASTLIINLVAELFSVF